MNYIEIKRFNHPIFIICTFVLLGVFLFALSGLMIKTDEMVNMPLIAKIGLISNIVIVGCLMIGYCYALGNDYFVVIEKYEVLSEKAAKK